MKLLFYEGHMRVIGAFSLFSKIRLQMCRKSVRNFLSFRFSFHLYPAFLFFVLKNTPYLWENERPVSDLRISIRLQSLFREIHSRVPYNSITSVYKSQI